MTIHIIGGGIIGLCTAWYLRQEGYEITVIDQTNLTDGTSHGNAGMIVPSHFTPLATPGVIAKGMRWMFDSKSPFFIKPRLSLDLFQWLWQFYRACSAQKVQEAIPILRDYNEWSKQLYREFATKENFQFCFEEKGLLMLYKNVKAEKEEKEVAEQAHELGMEAKVLSAAEVQKLEKGIQLDILGGVYYPDDAHLYPNLFINQIIQKLQNQGVQFLPGQAVTKLKTNKGNISHLLLSNQKEIAVKKVVLAAGSWSAKLLKPLGLKMLLQDGKGYSITLPKPVLRPSIPTILAEAKVAITPMGQDLRIGGTLEISNFSTRINQSRLAGILESIPRYYPDLKIETPNLKKVWHGFRPCTPDGLPYVGHSPKYGNLLLATGHAMMGMSLGPATGKLVAEIVTNKKASLPVEAFRLERF